MNNDPVRDCLLYRDRGCNHVDGFLCDYPDCSMLKDYEQFRSDLREHFKELKSNKSPVPYA